MRATGATVATRAPLPGRARRLYDELAIELSAQLIAGPDRRRILVGVLTAYQELASAIRQHRSMRRAAVQRRPQRSAERGGFD